MLHLAFALLAQAPSQSAAVPTIEEDRLRLCLTQAAVDTPGAIVMADRWLAEARGTAKARPLQCLGHAYTLLLRWPAAEQAFATAAEALGDADPPRRAALAAQAGNAALAGGNAARALTLLDDALGRAREPVVRGETELDRARALVALSRTDEARAALAAARRDAPDAELVWLFSATLSRRDGDLAAAQRQIEVAARLAPQDPEIGLEAGVIAMLGGREAAARYSWQSVVRTAPGSPAAATAQGYLAQLGTAAETGPGGR